jgi:hypothetical protein
VRLRSRFGLAAQFILRAGRHGATVNGCGFLVIAAIRFRLRRDWRAAIDWSSVAFDPEKRRAKSGKQSGNQQQDAAQGPPARDWSTKCGPSINWRRAVVDRGRRRMLFGIQMLHRFLAQTADLGQVFGPARELRIGFLGVH